jgi:DNA-binding CsgD family transcriptional regulator
MRLEKLTRREAEIAAIAPSRSNKELAAELGISEQTVKNHLRSVFLKVRVKSRRDLSEALSLRGRQN